MKKILSSVAVGLLACVSVMASINWNSGSIENLAKGSTVITSSNEGDAANIVDGVDGTSWQASAATHPYTHDWVIIDLGAEKTFTDMEIIWEASHCKSYSIYVSTDKIDYTAEETDGIKYNKIDDAWLAAQTVAATGGDSSEGGYTENIQFETPQTGQYILIYADDYNNFGSAYGMRIFEIRIADIQGRDEVDALKLTQEGNAVAGGAAVTVTVVPVNKLGDAMDVSAVSDLKLTCDNEVVTIEAGEKGSFAVKASAYGTFELTATAMADGKEITGALSFIVAYNWSNEENIATNKSVQGRVNPNLEDVYPPQNAVDGDIETYYQYNGEYGGGDCWVLVDLGDEYEISAIGAYYGGSTSNGRCMFGYATDSKSIEEKIAAEGSTDFVWNVTEGWTFSEQLTRTPDAVTTYICPAEAVARYIVVKDADNPSGKPCINEIYVAGTKREAPKAAELVLSVETPGLVIGETTAVNTIVYDQYGNIFEAQPEITVNGAEYANGVITGNAKGMVTVKASIEGIEKELQFFVADENDYCLDGSVITASEGASDNMTAVTDGGKVITSWGVDYILAADEPAGEHEHWILVKLARPYDLDLIAVLWEGACPADYDVYLGTTENDLQLYYSQKDKEGLHNYSDRFSGKEMTDIRYIKVVTTKNATDYGIKLHDLKAYGVSNAESVAEKIELTADNNYIPTETEVTLTTAVYDQFGAQMTDAEVKFSCDDASATFTGNQFKASEVGTYTVRATAGTATAEVVINVVVDADKKLSAETMINEAIRDGAELENTNIFAYNEIQFASLPATLVLDFENICDYDLIDICWEAAAPSDYTVEATYDDGTSATILSVTGRKFQNGYFPVDKIISQAASARTIGDVATANLRNIKTLKFTITAKDHEYPIRLLGMDAYGTFIRSGINGITIDVAGMTDVYNLQGMKIRRNVKVEEALEGLPRGIYIVGGRKVCK